MAKTIAKAYGIDKNRTKETHRLGSEASEVLAATFRTFVRAFVDADGSGWIRVTQNGKEIHYFSFEKE